MARIVPHSPGLSCALPGKQRQTFLYQPVLRQFFCAPLGYFGYTMPNMNSITLPRPDDWHLHLRDGPVLHDVVPVTAQTYARAIVMPNLKPPVTTVADALAYRERILAAVPTGMKFEPLMVLYLTEATTPEEIDRAADCPHVYAVKFYPAGATTNAEAGVSDLNRCMPVLERMAERDLPLLIHGEVADQAVDPFDREARFIAEVLTPLVQNLPELRIVFEHITTAEAAAFVEQAPENVAATVTPQHLAYDRRALFAGGLRPHFYCLPILKRNVHKDALVAAVTGPASHKFFLGTDSAPHAQHAKESACGCAGVFNAPCALEVYAEVFEQTQVTDKFDKFIAFASSNGPRFYGLPVNEETITLERKSWTMPASLPFADGKIIPLRAAETLQWRISGQETMA